MATGQFILLTLALQQNGKQCQPTQLHRIDQVRALLPPKTAFPKQCKSQPFLFPLSYTNIIIKSVSPDRWILTQTLHRAQGCKKPTSLDRLVSPVFRAGILDSICPGSTLHSYKIQLWNIMRICGFVVFCFHCRHRDVYTNIHFLVLNYMTKYCALQKALTEKKLTVAVL